MKRRLAAILAADVVGYSRMIRADEEGTLAALHALREEVIDPKIDAHGGRIVKLMGDGLLVEFTSVVDAVACGADVQQAMADRNESMPETQRIVFRVGINLGDVIIDGDDIQGDGVNVAARLEALAVPGGICVSDAVHEQVRDRLELTFGDLGPQEIKNIDRPVQAWSWSPSRAETAPSAGSEQASPPLPDKPSIAVLPFDNMSGDPEQEYFSDGITEDIITELSRFHSLHVIARHSAFTFKGQAIDIQEIARQLRVRYVVEGSVRRSGNRIRVTCQLIEAASDNHVWAERYDRELEDIFKIQDDLVRMIATNVGARIEAADKKRATKEKGPNVSAYDLCLRAQSLQDRNTREAYDEAESCLSQAIKIDPHLAQAYHQLSLVKFWQWFVNWSEDPDRALSESFDLARKALAHDDTDGLVHAHLSMLHLYRREFGKAGHRIEQALRLNPNDAKVQGIYGEHLIAVGEAKKAIDLFETLTQLNPREPAWITRLRAVAHMTMGDYETAISVLESLASPSNLARAWLASSLAHAGRIEDAEKMLDKFLSVAEQEMASFPGRSVADWKSAWRGIPHKNDAESEHFFDGLRKAGLRD